uniref:Uncharacterized protein AlNc14C478G11873 n=1 Tax=Albugo laibachii Nc14 TaxID=890382 RepID=F0X0D4_9STRA|nr:conserved hypothetical protein [Albugo laibachii Nc14]|eukprot:CCA27219.1 conserved hypothetical protein [Albugo laibachii Nc14]
MSDDREVFAPILSTLFLGFVEGCIHFRHRPICLRFAIKYSLWNILPSVVYRTIPAQTVATAFKFQHNLLLEALRSPSTSHEAKKVIWIETVRCARYCSATFGLLWAIWSIQLKPHRKDELKPIRLAPQKSEYVKELQNGADGNYAIIADKRTIADYPGQSSIGTNDRPKHPLQVIEIERTDKSDEPTMEKLSELEQRAESSGILLYRVGLVSARQFTISSDARYFDIYFSPSAILVKALCDHLGQGQGIVYYYDACETWAGISITEMCNALCSRGLNIQRKIICDHVYKETESTPVIIAASSFAEARQACAIIRKQNSSILDRKRSKRKSVIVLHESLTTAQKEEIEMCQDISILSVTQLCNQLFRDIRKDLDNGHSAKNIQNKLRLKYGACNGHFRHDFHSDITMHVW